MNDEDVTFDILNIYLYQLAKLIGLFAFLNCLFTLYNVFLLNMTLRLKIFLFLLKLLRRLFYLSGIYH